MVSDLIAEAPSSFDALYHSHPDKALRVHMNGVIRGVRKRTDSCTALTAALFHDLGKLSPNFQPKLSGTIVPGYSSHAYLSAHAFWCYCKTNPEQMKHVLGIQNLAEFFSTLAQIALHHGNLPDFTKILSLEECDRMVAFLADKPDIPVSEFLQQWLPHEAFDILDEGSRTVTRKWFRLPDPALDNIKNKLDFFLDTHHSFACLIEADKRDAGNNQWYQRDDYLEWARQHFTPLLSDAISKLSPRTDLDRLRSAIREEATKRLVKALPEGKRTFSLTAPTGAGKTIALLALADEIRSYANEKTGADYAVVYALPFLSITEQVDDICRTIFHENADFVTRLDSRSEDPQLEALLAKTDNQPAENAELLQRSFSRDTWDEGFIITTFVQLFETFLSNRNSTLLRLPNFDKCIFLLDEIQALPPRLYVFLAAYLQAFCEKFDCYAVFSTATMPALCLPAVETDSKLDASRLFSSYQVPVPLLDYEPYYHAEPFNRYVVSRIDNDKAVFNVEDLASHIRQTGKSCLVVMNTIDDSKRLYQLLRPTTQDDHILLLNTHFTLADRRAKIAFCKQKLKDHQPVILVSTQLIEAGVDIDFPAVYRDMCPLPNVIQSAGRCNRNRRSDAGQVYFFELHGDTGKSRAELIYRDRADRWMLDFSREHIVGEIAEHDLLQIQTDYFACVNNRLAVGDHPLLVAGESVHDNLIARINEAAFEIVGSFRLIDDNTFGAEYRYYVADNDDDTAWQDLKDKTKAYALSRHGEAKLSYVESKRYQITIEDQIRRMSDRVVQIRVYDQREPLPITRKHNGEPDILCGLRNLVLPKCHYSHVTGIDLKNNIAALI